MYTPEQINEAISKKADTRVMFINQILIISSAVFGILVSLHSESDKHNQIAFALSLVLLLLGILLLCIGLFGYVKVQDSLTKEILYQANRQYSGSTPDPATVDRKIGELNRKCEKYAYWILILALFSLAWYALI